MTTNMGRTALILAVAFGLAGCGSARFGGESSAMSARAAPPLPPAPAPVEAIPSGSVTSEPLAPLPGAAPSPVIADVPSMPSSPAPPPTVIANAAPSRSWAVGSYTARDATGSTCRVTLTGTATLDLYRASATGCQNRDLGRVTAWDFRDGEVYLYQPGGSVAARLRSEGGGLSGVIAKSGAPLTLTR